MCGITGCFSSESVIDVKGYYNAHLKIRHRGPDDEGFSYILNKQLLLAKGDDTIDEFNNLTHIDNIGSSNLVMGHRRLSIIDLSPSGHQPMFDQDSNFSLVFNGEIFNYIELRKELISLGHVFQTKTDTEVVLKSFIEWGKDSFNKFNGMWAIAIYSKIDNSLILSRDRFGIKPLYYFIENDIIYFASEMKFIRSYVQREFNINLSSVNDYIYKMKVNHKSTTFWEEIYELLPGHNLYFKNGRYSVSKYWKYEPKLIQYKDKAVNIFSDIFEDSLKLRMRSDVGVGSLLSGGLDSTTIVSSLHKNGLANSSDYKVFSAIFEEKQYSEKEYIEDTCKQLGIKADYVHPTPKCALDNLNNILFYMEEPFRSLSIISQFLLYKEIRDNSNIEVILNGQGADEIFAGYNSNYFAFFASLISKFRLITFIRELKLFCVNRKVKKRVVFRSIIKPLLYSLLNKNYFNNYLFNQVKISALREYLKHDDRMSMAFSLETRVPFLDYRLVEFALSLDSKYKIDKFINKKIVRDYAKEIIPDSVLNRKDKMGFISPQESWQKNELKSEIGRAFDYIESNGLLNLDKDFILSKYKSYIDGKNNDWPFIWRVFCLYRWLILEGQLKVSGD